MTQKITSLVACAACAIALLISSSPSSAGAPDRAAATAQAFFDYLTAPSTDIGTDRQAQARWLAEPLRQALVRAVDAVSKARLLPEVDAPDPAVPDNGSVLDAWDRPSKCVVQPDKRATRQRGQVDVLCSWGSETNYEGDQRRYTLTLVDDAGSFKVTELQAHRSKFASASQPLSKTLHELIDEAEALTHRASKAKQANRR